MRFFFLKIIRFEILKAIWDVPGKNNNDEYNADTTFPAKLLHSSFYPKIHKIQKFIFHAWPFDDAMKFEYLKS